MIHITVYEFIQAYVHSTVTKQYTFSVLFPFDLLLAFSFVIVFSVVQ
jgi:hypothetical protein